MLYCSQCCQYDAAVASEGVKSDSQATQIVIMVMSILMDHTTRYNPGEMYLLQHSAKT